MTMEYVSLPGETPPPVPDGPKLCSGDDMRIWSRSQTARA